MGLVFVAAAVVNKVFLNGRLAASVGNRWLLKWTSLIITEQGESCLSTLCVRVYATQICERVNLVNHVQVSQAKKKLNSIN